MTKSKSIKKEKKIVKNGEHREYQNGDLKAIKHYNKDRLHGIFIEWDDNGEVEEKGYYKNGKKHGRFVSFFSGLRLVEHYKKGKLHGKTCLRWVGGKKVEEFNYKNGEIHGLATWYYDIKN